MTDPMNNPVELARLNSPVRNRYFYGKLLTEKDFTREQNYLNRKRWLINRLGLGSGVVCGLEVLASDDGKCIILRPGVALDAFGREIIVPDPYCLENPRQPTDCLGRPQGDPIQGKGVVHLCLAYHECEIEPVPALVSGCDTRQGCEANAIRERYRVLVCADATVPGGLDDKQCAAIFPAEHDEKFDRSSTACQVLSGTCPEPQDKCVVIAAILLPEKADEAVQVQVCGHRRVIYSNGTLFDLIMCLADRVDDCCGQEVVHKLLRYVAGDAQTGQAGSTLQEALLVRVEDGNGQAVENEAVTFRVRGGGGAVMDAANTPQPLTVVFSDISGLAKVSWQIGPNPGLNTLEASIANGAQVVFTALGQGEAVHPPVIVKYEPPLGVELTHPQVKELFDTGLRIFFDRPMNIQDLEVNEKWLALWFVGLENPGAPPGNRQIVAMRAQLKLIEPNPPAPAAAVRYSIGLGLTVDEIIKRGYRGLIFARAEGANIRGDADGLLLDADYTGSTLDFNQTGLYLNDPARTLGEVLLGLPLNQMELFAEAFYDGLSAAAVPNLPTGDGQPGGLFASWFIIL